MSLNLPLLNVTQKASGAIAAYRIVSLTAFGIVAQSTLKTQKYFGINGHVAVADAGDIGVNAAGIVPVEYGGNVAVDDALTSDGSGRAVRAIAVDNIIGTAVQAGALGTIGCVRIAPQNVIPAA